MRKDISPVLKSLLVDIRQHPAFPELLTLVDKPIVPRFKASEAENVETARAKWIHRSGQRDQHDQWLYALTGDVPPRGDD